MLSRFRQNTFQLFLLFWGSLLHFCLTAWYISAPIAAGLFPTHFIVSPFLQLLNFLGLHFLFSWCYRSLPWRQIAQLVLWTEFLCLIVPIGVEATLIYLYQSPIDANFVLVMLASPRQETWEYLATLPLGVYLVVGSLLSSTAIFAYLGARYLKPPFKKWLGRRAKSFAKVVVVGCILAFVACFARNALNYHRDILINPPRSSNSTDRLFWAILRAAKERNLTAQHLKTMTAAEHFTGFSFRPTWGDSLQVVIILGESARADFMSAYGYDRPTTPFLDSLAKVGQIASYNDVVSSASSTLFSGQRIFSFWNNAAGKHWYNFPDLVTCCSRAGFRTRWISNQDANDYSSLERIFAFSADTLLTTASMMDNWIENSLDEKLLPLILQHHFPSISPNQAKQSPHTTNVAQQTNAPTLTIVHLVGSHQDYLRRYPPTFDYFKPEQMTECLTDDAKRQKAAYLNSLRYTDHLLEKMIAHYKNQRALVFYFSDHGEMVDEPQQRGFFGHGGNVDHPSVDVPFFVYASPQLRAEHPELWARIQKAQFRPISTAWFTNSLTSLLGIRTKYNDERYNFFSDSFANPTRIAVQGDTRHEIPPLKRRRVKACQ